MEPGNEVKDDILLPLDAKSGDSSLISRTVSKEEDAEQVVSQEAPHSNDSQFTKLDELLT